MKINKQIDKKLKNMHKNNKKTEYLKLIPELENRINVIIVY